MAYRATQLKVAGGQMAFGLFEASAPHYKFRTPYSPGFFAQLASKLPCYPHTELIDIACGTGTLSQGMRPFVRAITAVDSSPAMLAEARRDDAITYLQRDVNEEPLADMQGDHILIGRAIQWLDPDKLTVTLDNTLRPNGRIAICSSGFVEQVPWIARFRKLRREFGDGSTGAPGIHQRGIQRLESMKCAPVDRVSHTIIAKVTPDYLVRHAMSYHPSTAGILANMSEFQRRLMEIVGPLLQDGAVDAPIVSWAILFERR